MTRLPGFKPLLGCLALAFVPAANAATDILFTMDGVEGDYLGEPYRGWVVVQSSSLQLSRLDPDPRVPPVVHPLSLQKDLDAASIPLYLKLLSGERMNSATLAFSRRGLDADKRFEYARIELTGVVVSGVSQGATSLDTRPTETISLNFSKICFTYVTQRENGEPGRSSEGCWNVETNQPE